MWPVLLLFLIPVGGGIPAGVLLAREKGLAWPVTASLYFLSDLILAVAFEPILRLLVLVGRRIAFVATLSAAMARSMAMTAARFGGRTAGPFTLVLIAFGVDPMTGRAAALAAGHGFVTGWAVAIAGDMLYYGVIAVTTLRLSAYFSNPQTAMWIVLAGMVLVPILVRQAGAVWRRSGRSQRPVA
jgi:hypothetical protein